MLVKQFENYEIRHIYKDGQFYYSAQDILTALEYSNPSKIWSKLKPFIEGASGTFLVAEKVASNGKRYKMDYLSMEQCFLLLQKSEQPKAVPFQIFMARITAEYVQRAGNRINELLKEKQYWYNRNHLKLNAIPLQPEMEADLARRLHSWMCLCGYSNINIEHPILNLLNKDKRRFDFYRNTSKTIEAYELKKNPITVDDITTAICKRGYFEILQQQAYPNKSAKLIFLSPYNISPEVIRLVDTTHNQVSAITIKELAHSYFIKGLKRKWRYQQDHLNTIKLDPYYSCLFNEL
jgi:hypothetical protein